MLQKTVQKIAKEHKLVAVVNRSSIMGLKFIRTEIDLNDPKSRMCMLRIRPISSVFNNFKWMLFVKGFKGVYKVYDLKTIRDLKKIVDEISAE
jgi:hypothetical protein